MASTANPAKSQALHNFDLPHLKWNKDNNHQSTTANHHRRRTVKSPLRGDSSSAPAQQPHRDSGKQPLIRSSKPALDHDSSPRRSPLHGHTVRPSPLRGQSPGHGDSVTRSPRHGADSVKKQSPSRGGQSVKISPHRGGDPAKISPHRGGDSVKESLKEDSASESEYMMRNKGSFIGYHSRRSKDSASNVMISDRYMEKSEKKRVITADRSTEKSEKKLKVKEADVDVAKEKKSKILIKIQQKGNKSEEESPQDEPKKIGNDDNHDDDNDEVQDEGKNDEGQDEGKTYNNEEEPKTWNLRPRKPINKSLNVNGAGNSNGSAMNDKKAQVISNNSNGKSGENEGNAGGDKKKKKELTVFVALTKEEIEEDIFSMSGSKASRRPRKRPKHIQKQIDYALPGTWLTSITPDTYKVTENHSKG